MMSEHVNTADGNLAALQSAVQSSTYISPAGAAVDNNPTTASCTDDDQGQPWWAVDLGAAYTIHQVVVVMPDVNGNNRNYYSTSVLLSLLLLSSLLFFIFYTPGSKDPRG